MKCTVSASAVGSDAALAERRPQRDGIFDLASKVVPKSSNAGSRPVGDALALFQDSPKAAPRRLGAAEARAQARRCPTCGGVVPAGMSLCQTCGLDLETKTRVSLDDDLAPPP